MKIIALEDGFYTESPLKLKSNFPGGARYTMKTSSEIIGGDVDKASLDIGEGRIAVMDEAGIDIQVL